MSQPNPKLCPTCGGTGQVPAPPESEQLKPSGGDEVCVCGHPARWHISANRCHECSGCTRYTPAGPEPGEQSWQPFDDDYKKVFYEVKLPDGRIIENCWPNAGRIHVEGKTYWPRDGVMVRPQPDYREEDELQHRTQGDTK